MFIESQASEASETSETSETSVDFDPHYCACCFGRKQTWNCAHCGSIPKSLEFVFELFLHWRNFPRPIINVIKQTFTASCENNLDESSFLWIFDFTASCENNLDESSFLWIFESDGHFTGVSFGIGTEDNEHVTTDGSGETIHISPKQPFIIFNIGKIDFHGVSLTKL